MLDHDKDSFTDFIDLTRWSKVSNPLIQKNPLHGHILNDTKLTLVERTN